MNLPRAADFKPPRWLRNRHTQSLLGSSPLRRWLTQRRAIALETHAVVEILDVGAARLAGYHTAQRVRPQARGMVVLLHGWEGSAQSNYVLATGARLLSEGWDVFRLNFRDHGATHHLNADLFHSCRIDEVVAAVGAAARAHPAPRLAVVGYSLGGNFALRVALRAPTAGIPLDYALAVCPVISPSNGLARIERALWIYHAYFMLKWRASLRRKQAAFPDRRYFEPGELRQNMSGLTRSMVEKHTDYGTLENYLDGYSIAGDRLAGLQVPATLLTARDDPVIPVSDFEALRLPAGVELDIAEHGGHCGFLAGWRLHSFAEDYISARLDHLAP